MLKLYFMHDPERARTNLITALGGDSLKQFGTLRARVGYAVDRFLPYVTGGVAYGKFGHSLGCDAARVSATRGCQNRVSAFDTSDTSSDWGWTIGAGIDYAVTNNLVLKAQYLYADFGKHGATLTDPNYPSLSSRSFDSSYHSVSVGLSYKF